jgi:hypothetical protein
MPERQDERLFSSNGLSFFAMHIIRSTNGGFIQPTKKINVYVVTRRLRGSLEIGLDSFYTANNFRFIYSKIRPSHPIEY